MQVNLRDWIGQHIYVCGEYEPPVARLIQSVLREGDVFIDVGANIGYFSLLASKSVGLAGQVLAFEPDPQTRQMLSTNVEINHKHNIIVNEQALSDCLGEVSFYQAPREHSGLSSMRRLESAAGATIVQAGPLEAFFPHITGVRLVKIDVEGAESLVLHGMQALLRRDHPDLIVEITDHFLREMGSSSESLREDLAELGYRLFTVEEDALVPLGDCGPMAGQLNAYCTTATRLPPGIEVRSK
jgi:FkbM family methyltransferase